MTRDVRPRGAGRPPVRSMTQQVADALRERIQSENLQPGDRLGREQDLALEFGVSRPTMREALQMVSAGGLLRSTKGPGGGTFVHRSLEQALTHSLADRIGAMLDVDAVSLEELVTARIGVELPIVRLAATRITPDAIAELRRIVATIGEDPGDPSVTLPADVAFHRTIAEASGNPMLQATIGWAFEVLQPRLYQAVPPLMLEDVLVHQHTRIVDALESGDPEAAAAAMASHLDHLLAQVRDASSEDAPGATAP